MEAEIGVATVEQQQDWLTFRSNGKLRVNGHAGQTMDVDCPPGFLSADCSGSKPNNWHPCCHKSNARNRNNEQLLALVAIVCPTFRPLSIRRE